MQSKVYTGYKTVHCLKYMSIAFTPCLMARTQLPFEIDWGNSLQLVQACPSGAVDIGKAQLGVMRAYLVYSES